MESLADTIHIARTNKELTLSQLSKKAGISIVMISDIENGNKIPTKGKSLEGLAKSLGLDYEDLVSKAVDSKLMKESSKTRTSQYDLKMSLARKIIKADKLEKNKIEEILEIINREG